MAGISGGQSRVIKAPSWTAVATGNAKAAIGYGAASDAARNFPTSNASDVARAKANTSLNSSLNASNAKATAKKTASNKASIAKSKAKANAADLKKDKSNTQKNLGGLSGIDQGWLKSQLGNYGSQISSKEAARIAKDWASYNSSRISSIPTLPSGTPSNRVISSEEQARTEAANQENILAQKQRDEDWTKFSDVQSQREKAASAYQNQYSTDRAGAEKTFGNLGDWVQNNIGIPTANAATTNAQPSGGQSWIGDAATAIGKGIFRGAQVISDPFNKYGKISELSGIKVNNPVTDIANLLNLNPKQQGMVFDVGDNLKNSTTPSQDQPTGYGPNGEQYFQGYDPAKDGGTVMKSDFPTDNSWNQKYDRPGSTAAAAAGISPADYGSIQNQAQVAYGSQAQPAPQPFNPILPGISSSYAPSQGMNTNTGALSAISGNQTPVNFGGTNPFTPNLGTGTIDQTNPFPGLTPVEQTPQFTTATDNTPLTPDNGTIGQFLGSGRLSGGLFSNGKGNLNLGGALGGGSPWEQQKNDILGNTANAQDTFNQLQDSNQNIISQGQDIINSIDPQLAATNPEYKALVDQFSQLTDQAKTANGNLALNTGGSVAPTSITTNSSPMANLNLTGGSSISSTQAGDLQPAMVGQSTKSAKTKTKKSKDPYQAMLDQQNSFYQSQTDAATAAQGKQAADRQAALQSILSGLDTQYNQSGQTGQDALNSQKQKDSIGLNSMYSFGYNQDPNSQDRIQAQERMNNDYSSQIAAFLAKEAGLKAGDYNTANTNYLNQNTSADAANNATMAQLAASRQSSLTNIQQASIAAQAAQKAQQQALEQQQWSNNMASKQFNASQAAQMNSQSQSQQKYQNDLLQNLLSQGANMSSGGRDYVLNAAQALGIQNAGAYVPDNVDWGAGLRKDTKAVSGQPQLKQDENGNWYYETN